MNDLPKLMDAVYAAFNNGLPGQKWEPKGDVTHCNEAVSSIASAMGYGKFTGFVANQIFDALQTNNDWQDVNFDAAQFHANQGALVIAAWKNPEGGHGHVCVVIPGRPERSESWDDISPKVMNIGVNNFIGLKASFAFSAERKPKFFALKSMV